MLIFIMLILFLRCIKNVVFVHSILIFQKQNNQNTTKTKHSSMKHNTYGLEITICVCVCVYIESLKMQ